MGKEPTLKVVALRRPEPPLDRTKRVGGYVRVSTEIQVERGESLDVQAERLEAEAERRGWDLVLYREPGLSAKDSNRPVYQKMRADLEAGRIQGIVATKLDRLWRNLALAVAEVEFITKQCQADLITLDQQLDTTTAAGRVVLNILLSFGQFEREVTAERVIEAMLARARHGRFCGGPIAFGFCQLGKDVLGIEESEAEIVRKIFARFLETSSVAMVTRALNLAGLRTRSGGLWAPSSVARILQSPLYVGAMSYNRHDRSSGKVRRRSPDQHICVPDVLPAIVDTATFQRVQTMFGTRPRLAPRSQASDFLLAGLVRCEKCGSAMWGQTKWRRRSSYATRKPRPLREGAVPLSAAIRAQFDESLKQLWARNRVEVAHRYYRCNRNRRNGRAGCPGNSVRAPELERVVLDRLFDLRVNPARLRELAEEWQRKTDDPVARKTIADLERRLVELDRQEARILEAFEQGHYSVQTMKQRRQAVLAEREQVEPALAEARARIRCESFDVEKYVGELRTAYDVFERLPFEGQRSMLHDLVHHIVAGKHAGEIVLSNRLPAIAGGLLRDSSDATAFSIDKSSRAPRVPREIRLIAHDQSFVCNRTGRDRGARRRWRKCPGPKRSLAVPRRHGRPLQRCDTLSSCPR